MVQSLLAGAAALLSFAAAWPVVSQSCDDLAGPHPVAADVLAHAITVADLPHRFVEVECGDIFETGVEWQEITTSHGVETSRKSIPFWAARVGPRFLLIRSPTKPGGKFAGQTGRIEAGVVDQFAAKDRAVLLPFALTEEDPRVGGVILGFLLLGAAGWFSYLTVRSVRRFADPRRHPAIARLAADGDLRELSKAAERELAAPGAVPFRGRVLTPQFFLDRRWPRFQLRRWTSLVWAYANVTQHRVYHFIPAGKTYDLVLAFDDGTRLRLKQRSFVFGGHAEKDVADMLAHVAELAPWAVIGFDAARERSWRKARAAFVDAAAKRRAEIQAGSA